MARRRPFHPPIDPATRSLVVRGRDHGNSIATGVSVCASMPGMASSTDSAIARRDAADPSLLPADEIARAIGVEVRTGLTATEAARRLATDGPNVLRAKPPVPTWRKLRSH